MFADEKNQNNKDERKDIGDYFWGAGYSHGTGFRPFHEKISENPEHKDDFQHHFSHRMGNVNWVCLCCGAYTYYVCIKGITILQADVHHPSIRDRFYAFVGLSELNRRAVDIAFGSSGYILELSRAFRKVSSAPYSFMIL